MKIDKYFHLWGDKDGKTVHFEEVEPLDSRPKGKWRIEAGIGCYCSKCNFDISNDFDCMEYVNFCPNCGADMRK